MIRSFYYVPTGELREALSLSEIATLLQKEQGVLWVDLVEEPVESCAQVLSDIFHFHPLPVDDALRETHVPKVDDWGDYLYIVMRSAFWQAARDANGYVDTTEEDVFLGRHYLVTYQRQAVPAVAQTWDLCRRDPRQLSRGTAYLLYRLIDGLADHYMEIIAALDDIIDRIEDQIFDDPQPAMLEEMFMLKRDVLDLRRLFAPQREVLNKLSRGDYPMIAPEYHVFFRDVYDHLVRLYDITESMRDLVSGALDTYLSVVNNRMNEVMKTLTLITTLFMPLSFIVGFFGMNFFQPAIPLPAWTGTAAFVLTLVSMVGVPLGMYLWMRRRSWM